MTRREQRIREEALTWIGTPFHHRARVKGVGVDCANLLICVYQNIGLLNGFVPNPYPPDWMLHRDEEIYLRAIELHADLVDPPWRVGDILTFRFGRCVSHSGLWIGEGEFLHADRFTGVVKVQFERNAMAHRFHGAYRLRAMGEA